MKLLHLFLLLGVSSYPTIAAISYTFELRPIVSQQQPLVQASSFTIVRPDYLLVEGPFTTGPFDLTFEGNSVPITQAYLSASYGSFCFTFGSDEATLVF